MLSQRKNGEIETEFQSIEGASARATGAAAGSASSACASEVRHHGEADDDSPALRRTASLREPGAGQNSEPGNVQTTGQSKCVFPSENEGEVEHKRPTFQRIALATETEADIMVLLLLLTPCVTPCR